MKWLDRITVDKNVLAGKPIVRGTRISVEFIVDLLGKGWTREQILAEYDHLKPEDIHTCLAYDHLRREIQIGIDDLERGDYEEFDDESLEAFFEQIKAEGRKELEGESEKGMTKPDRSRGE